MKNKFVSFLLLSIMALLILPTILHEPILVSYAQEIYTKEHVGSRTIVDEIVDTPAGTYQYYTFDIPADALDIRLSGTYEAHGGIFGDVDVIVADGSNCSVESIFSCPVYLNEKKSLGQVDISLPAGKTYYLIFDNTESIFADKQTEATFNLEFNVLVRFLNYENSTFGIQIEYPSNFGIDETDYTPGDRLIEVVYFTPLYGSEVDTFSESIGLLVDTSSVPANANEYLSGLINSYESDVTDFKVIESNTNDITLAGLPAYKLQWTEKSLEDGISLRRIEVGTIVEDKVYKIIYNAEVNEYNRYVPTIQRMIDSFQIINK
jgi:hypothetical protein